MVVSFLVSVYKYVPECKSTEYSDNNSKYEYLFDDKTDYAASYDAYCSNDKVSGKLSLCHCDWNKVPTLPIVVFLFFLWLLLN